MSKIQAIMEKLTILLLSTVPFQPSFGQPSSPRGRVFSLLNETPTSPREAEPGIPAHCLPFFLGYLGE